MRKKVLFLFLILFLFINKFKAQHSEIGILLGTSYYVGELNPSNPFINKINPAIGVLYRKNLNKRYALRYGLNYGLLGADDNYNKTEWNKVSNLSFSTSILEASVLLEFNFLPYQINNYNTSPFTPLKFDFIRNIGLNIEWGVRKTFTDEIDGLPQTYSNGYQISNSNNNDWYSFAGITLNYKILTKTDRCPVVK
ncbi:MAG: hypothetical protein HYU68_05160 [Bacteroidetes bacterium]|nr:hypothetical protein [Bacteroidota bacterium]